MNDLMNRIDALLRFSADVEGRMAHTGLGGVFGVADQLRRVRQALDQIQPNELDWARAELRSLVDLLSGLAASLDEIGEAKLLLSGNAAPSFAGPGPGGGYVTTY